MATKSTIWPIYVVGVICFGVFAALVLIFVTTDGFDASAGQDVALAVPLLAGVAAFRAGFEERARQRAGMPRSARKLRRRAPPLEPAPRLGDDPFRDPPGTPPIVIERHASPVMAPIVPGDPTNRPKLLT